MNKQNLQKRNSNLAQANLISHPTFSRQQQRPTKQGRPHENSGKKQSSHVQAAVRPALEESCSSAFYSEEGNQHLNESSFSSMNEETPTLIPKRISTTKNQKKTHDFSLQLMDMEKIQTPNNFDLLYTYNKNNSQNQNSSSSQFHNIRSPHQTQQPQISLARSIRDYQYCINQNQQVKYQVQQLDQNLAHLPQAQFPDNTQFAGNHAITRLLPPIPKDKQTRRKENDSNGSLQQAKNGSGSQTRQQPQIMMDSMSLIQKNRAQIQNRSNSQSVRDTIVSTQQIESQHLNLGSSINNKVSEQPSESCSMMDEHEPIEVIEIHQDSKESSESKSSDKENSNIRNNKETREETLITPSLPKSSRSKVGLSDQSVKNIRIAPVFKGLTSVLQTSSANNNNKKQRKIQSSKKYCATQVEETKINPMPHHNASHQGHSKPIVVQNKDQPNVYIIERPPSNCQRQKGNLKASNTPKSSCLISSKGTKNSSIKQLKFQEDSYQTSYQIPINKVKSTQNQDRKSFQSGLVQNFGPIYQPCYSEMIEQKSSIKYQNADSRQMQKQQQKYGAPVYGIHAIQRVNTEGNSSDVPHSNLDMLRPHSNATYMKGINNKSNNMHQQQQTQEQMIRTHFNQNSTHFRNQLSLINEESCQRINTDPGLYQQMMNKQNYLKNENFSAIQASQKMGMKQYLKQNQQITQAIHKQVGSGGGLRESISQFSNQSQIDQNLHPSCDFIDQNEINDGIVYIEGGIGLHNQRNAGSRSNNSFQQRLPSGQRNIVQNAREFNKQYLGKEENFQHVTQGNYVNMSKNNNRSMGKNIFYVNNMPQKGIQQQTQMSSYSTAIDNNYPQNNNHYQRGFYCQTEPLNPRSKSNAPNYQVQPDKNNEKYIQALKRMEVGDGYGDPESSSSSDSETEQEDDQQQMDYMMGQKIFFTDGGRTHKNSKKLIEAGSLKQRSKEEEISKQSKCIIM